MSRDMSSGWLGAALRHFGLFLGRSLGMIGNDGRSSKDERSKNDLDGLLKPLSAC